MLTRLDTATWRKSSYSGDNGTCVEVAFPAGAIAARDSKDPEGGMLVFDRATWSRFLGTITTGTFDRH
ncbi:DUF397 domain-containing protein [Saccharopolyspora sp. 5N708]|uniref:DUF397 domain-containing protein n=1 Tax=Saccharopolyspora sp. 5N708 TaxID=3457424 RepID=UPI003FD31B07